MGCVVSSVSGASNIKISVLPADMGPEADVPDPKSSMTPRQIAYINLTWNLVRPEMKMHGVKLFISLFETHPIIQTRFKDLDGKPLDTLNTDKTLKAHATTVMSALDSYISTLDDLEAITEMLLIAGVNHKNRGIRKSDFQLLVPVLIEYLRNALQGTWSDEAEDAWKHLMKLILSLLFSAYNTYDDD